MLHTEPDSDNSVVSLMSLHWLILFVKLTIYPDNWTLEGRSNGEKHITVYT